MLSEKQWQSQLIKAAQQDYGGWALRLSPLQTYGAPDLLLILRGYSPAFIECKVVHRPGIEQSGGSVTVATTALQKETLRRIKHAGGLAGVWVLVNDHLVLVSSNPDAEYLQIGEAECMMRERGRPWPIAALIHRTAS